MLQMLIECPKCKGTGLYRGCCERGGAAVICHSCKGKGTTLFGYVTFSVESEDF